MCHRQIPTVKNLSSGPDWCGRKGLALAIAPRREIRHAALIGTPLQRLTVLQFVAPAAAGSCSAGTESMSRPWAVGHVTLWARVQLSPSTRAQRLLRVLLCGFFEIRAQRRTDLAHEANDSVVHVGRRQEPLEQGLQEVGVL